MGPRRCSGFVCPSGENVDCVFHPWAPGEKAVAKAGGKCRLCSPTLLAATCSNPQLLALQARALADLPERFLAVASIHVMHAVPEGGSKLLDKVGEVIAEKERPPRLARKRTASAMADAEPAGVEVAEEVAEAPDAREDDGEKKQKKNKEKKEKREKKEKKTKKDKKKTKAEEGEEEEVEKSVEKESVESDDFLEALASAIAEEEGEAEVEEEASAVADAEPARAAAPEALVTRGRVPRGTRLLMPLGQRGLRRPESP